MTNRRDADDYWKAVGAALGGECVAYTDEELATFADGTMREADARHLRAHLESCATCRELVAALQAEAARYEPARAIPARPAPLGGWNRKWVFAPVAVAAMAVLVALALRVQQAPVPTGEEPPRAVIADRSGTGEPPAPPEKPVHEHLEDRPPVAGPADEPSGAAPIAAPVPPRPHRARSHPEPQPRPQPQPAPQQAVPFEEAIARAPALINRFPEVLTFSTADTEGLFEDLPSVDPTEYPDMVNDLPGGVPPEFPEAAVLTPPVNGGQAPPSTEQFWLEATGP